MKHFLLFLFSLTYSLSASSQFCFKERDSIDVNQINAAMGVHGNLWFKHTDSARVACEFPKGSGKHIAFAGSVWIGGYHQGVLKVAAQLHDLNTIDYWPGPIVDPITQPSLSYTESQKWARVWKVTRGHINSHLANASHSIANTPSSVLEWPGRGNIHAKGNNGVMLFTPLSDYDRPFAPFVDVNQNGIYEPLSGDYPEIIGDQALWTIFNDNGADKKQLTLTETMGIEIRCLAYAYSRNTLVDNVVFYEYEILNRLGDTYDSVSIGFYADIDLGYPYDEYIGYDSTRNLAITYNADTLDGNGEPNSYRNRIPLAGIRLLEMPGGGCSNFRLASSFSYFTGLGIATLADPTIGIEFYNYMNSSFRFGQPFIGGGRYLATDDPSIFGGDSECAHRTNPGDRRMIISSKMDSSFQSGSSVKFAVALVASEPAIGNACPGVTFAPIQQVADTALNAYCNPLPILTTSMNEVDKQLFKIYPNPATDEMVIELEANGNYQISIADLAGRILFSKVFEGNKYHLDVSHFTNGLYIITLQNEQEKLVQKFIKR